jgi:hypothetical protein
MDGPSYRTPFWIQHPAHLNSIAHRRAACPVLAGSSLPVRFAEKDCGDPALACAIRKSRVTVHSFPRHCRLPGPV